MSISGPFNLASGDLLSTPPLISNSLHLPFGTQGRSWRLESCLQEMGDKKRGLRAQEPHRARLSFIVKGWATHTQEARGLGFRPPSLCGPRSTASLTSHGRVPCVPSCQPLLPGWHLVRKWEADRIQGLIYLPSCVFPSITGFLQVSELSVPHLAGF